MTNEILMKIYSTVVVSALTVAFGLATVVQKKYNPAKEAQLIKFIALPSAVVVRFPEITTGIPLLTADNTDVLPGSTSKIAARIGVYTTTFSRAVLQAPAYYLPPLLMKYIPLLRNMARSNPAVGVPLTTYLAIVAFGIGLPGTLALFPQIAEIVVNECEEEFRGLTDSNGRPYRKFYYNKGL